MRSACRLYRRCIFTSFHRLVSSINGHIEGGISIACDAANNNYALGNGSGFIYLTKRDKFGNFQWQRSSTSSLGENAVRVFVDPQGNAVAVGYRYSTLHEGPFAVALIILKYTPDGNPVYKTVIPGTYTYFNNSGNITNITAEMDGDGNVYIGTEGQVSGYPKQGFNAVKIASNGNIVWVRTESFNNGSNFFYVSNIRLKGNMLGLTGTTLYFSANTSTWVLDTAGTSLWSDVSAGILGKDVAFDKDGNIYVLTSLANPDFDHDLGLYKFNKTGQQLFLKRYDFGSAELGYRMEMMPENNLAITGVGTQQNGGLPYVDWIIAKVNRSGTLLWSKRYDKTINNDEIPRMIIVDKSNNIYVTGDGGPFTGGSNLGALQGVTLKYSSKGARRWRSLLDTLSFDCANIALGTDTSIFAISKSASAVVHLLQTTGTDVCSVPVSLTATSVTNDASTLTWNTVANAFLYHVEYKTSTGVTWIGISTDLNHYKLSGLFPGTTYDYRIEAVCNSGPTGFSNINQFSTSGSGYCMSKGLNSSKEWIDFVMVEAISSGSVGSNDNNGGYADFTSLSTDLVQNSTYSITTSAAMQGGPYNEGWSVWIDYNQDGDFDEAGELVVQFKSSQVGWEMHPFTVPGTATLGPTKMRVAMKNKTYGTSCEIFARGEVEDYTVNIVDAQNLIARHDEIKPIGFPNNISSNTPLNVKTNVASDNSLYFFPNPAKDYIILNLKADKRITTINIYDR